MSPQKRVLPSTSSGRASLLRRPRTARTNQRWRSSGRNLVTRSWLTEDDVRRVVREEFMGAWEHVKSDLAEYCQRCMGNAPEEIMQQKLMATVELANNHSPHLGRVDARSMGINDVRNLRLQFQTKLSDPLFTGRKLRGVGGARISVALIDANAGDVVTSILESSIKLDVVVLEGDFDKDDEDDWTHEEFKNFVVKERQQKGQLLKGDLQVTLNGGVGELGELIFTDNSSWNRSKKFRIGLKKASGYCGNTRIREAKTNAFHVKEHRGESKSFIVHYSTNKRCPSSMTDHKHGFGYPIFNILIEIFTFISPTKILITKERLASLSLANVDTLDQFQERVCMPTEVSFYLSI